MSRLAALRSHLSDLRRRRQNVRWGTALAGWGAAGLLTLVALFAVDWLFEPGKAQRLVMLVVGLGVLYWAFKRLALPWLGHQETDLDMALMVERQQKIDSDLVAALQFESPQAASWGSSQLEHAVIEYVAEFGNDIQVLEGFSRRQLLRRSALLAGVATLIVVGVFIYPRHAAAFVNRLFLGSAHYPTKTVIQTIVLNGKSIFPPPKGFEHALSPQGDPLAFEVHAGGELPLAGRVELTTVDNNLRTTVELKASGAKAGVFVGTLPRLVDTVSFQLFLGDAWTDAAIIEAIELPVVNVRLDPTPPDYAAGAPPPLESSGGSRQISVLEGSSVELQVACLNKALKQVTLSIEGKAYPLAAQDKEGREWRLQAHGSKSHSSKSHSLKSHSLKSHSLKSHSLKSHSLKSHSLKARGTPLAQVVEPLQYEIQVLDEHGLELERPIQGFIRIKTDRAPRVSADLITRRVLPTAKPRISYEAADDYGIATLRARCQTARGSGGMQDTLIDIPIATGRKKLLRGKLPIDLGPLKLAKGDELKITLEAIDFRGSRKGKLAVSEPLVLEVTDERGVLAGMIESDERLARQLDAVIERQIGIGDSK